MTIYEHWLIQKEQLRPLLAEQNDMAGVVYQVRHALLQTEQNALAELTDDILRQQAGVLLSCIKNSAGLLETHINAQVWVPQSMKITPKANRSLWLFSLIALLATMRTSLEKRFNTSPFEYFEMESHSESMIWSKISA